MEKEECYGVVEPACFCDIFGRNIRCFRISLVLLVLFGALMQHVASWWRTNYTVIL